MSVKGWSKGENTIVQSRLKISYLPISPCLIILEPRLNVIVVHASINVSKISVVGVGMRSQPGVAKTMFTTLADKGVNIQVISTSEIKVSVLIASDYTELAVRALHSIFELDNSS